MCLSVVSVVGSVSSVCQLLFVGICLSVGVSVGGCVCQLCLLVVCVNCVFVSLFHYLHQAIQSGNIQSVTYVRQLCYVWPLSLKSVT